MATLPGAETSVEETAGAQGAGLDRICVMAPVAVAADMLPRSYGNAAAIYAKHGHSEGLGYSALHFRRTGKPLVFLGLPIETPGEISRQVTGGNSGTGATTVEATDAEIGVLAEHDGVLRVIRGGDFPIFGLSLDGGHTEKRVRLGGETTYTDPYFGITIDFAPGLERGTFIEGDTIHEWHGSAPKAAMADVATARANLANDSKLFRTMILCSQLDETAEAAAYVSELNAYETENQRYIVGRGYVFDHCKARMSQSRVTMTGEPSITFAEVGGTGDTITRGDGSFVTDGFAANMVVKVRGASTAGNNVTDALITAVTATVLTLDTADLADGTDAAGVTIVGSYPVTFSAVGAGTETVTRHASSGSWIEDGFLVGETAVLDHSTGTFGGAEGSYVISAVSDTVLTVLDPDTNFVAGSYASHDANITSTELLTDWIARAESEFEDIQGESRIDMSAGRARVTCPFTKWNLRRPAAWFASFREYQHDLHIPTWRKSDGPVGASLEDADGIKVEWDDRKDVGGEAAANAGFTCLRTWSNDPGTPAFVGVSVTRASEDLLQSYTHNKAVINHAQAIVQRSTENVAVGQSLILNRDGTATKDSIRALEGPINDALKNELLSNKQNEGQRASYAVCTIDPSVLYNVPEPVMLTNTELLINGTVHSVQNKISVSR